MVKIVLAFTRKYPAATSAIVAILIATIGGGFALYKHQNKPDRTPDNSGESSIKVNENNGTIIQVDTINYGVSEETFRAHFKEQLQETKALLERAHTAEKQVLKQKIAQLEQQLQDFNNTVREYQALQQRLQQMETLPGNTPEITTLVIAAKNHISALEFKAADNKLEEAEQLALTALDRMQQQLAVIVQSRAEVAKLQGNIREAVILYQQALSYNSEDFELYIEAARAQQSIGPLETAKNYADAALALAQKQQHLRNQSIALNTLGDIYSKQGKSEAALTAYQQALAIAEQLAAADPGNSQWQRDLSVSYNKVGDIYSKQGKSEAALTAYQQALAIRKQLAAADPGNSGWQEDLAYSLAKVTFLDESKREVYIQRAIELLRQLEQENRLSAQGERLLTWLLEQQV